MQCNFSYKHYKDLLESALKAGFKITNFHDFHKDKKNPKVIILRHDVDINPEKALDFAKIEEKLGIFSTYFIRVHGEYYFFSKKNVSIFKKILELGHEIGLHTEASALSGLWRMKKKDIFLEEKKFLEEILDIKVETAAEHADLGRPKNFWQHHFFAEVSKNQVGIKNYPQEKKFANFKYFSDSLKKWREKCLCLNLEKYDKIQVTIHADWWQK